MKTKDSVLSADISRTSSGWMILREVGRAGVCLREKGCLVGAMGLASSSSCGSGGNRVVLYSSSSSSVSSSSVESFMSLFYSCTRNYKLVL